MKSVGNGSIGVKTPWGRTALVPTAWVLKTDEVYKPRPKSKPVPLDQPTRRTVEALLKSLVYRWGHDEDCPLHARYETLRLKRETLEEELEQRYVEANPKLRKLKRAENAAYSRYRENRNLTMEKALEIQRLYRANGITKEVIKSLNKLIKG